MYSGCAALSGAPRQFAIVATLILATGFIGCESKQELKDEYLVGVWVEIPDAPQASPRFKPAPRLAPQMRKLTAEPDGTFALTLSDAQGKGDAGKAIRGKWKISGPDYVLEAAENKLGDKFKPWTPTFVSMNPPEAGAPAPSECTVVHEDGSQARYKKQ